MVVRWINEAGEAVCGYGALEAKKAQLGNEQMGRTLNATEKNKVEAYLKKRPFIVKYLIYSKDPFEVKKFEDEKITIKAKCLTIENLKELNYSLKVRELQDKSITVGQQIAGRYLQGKDLYIPTDPPPRKGKDELRKIIEKIKTLNEETEGSIIFINYNGRNAISEASFNDDGFKIFLESVSQDKYEEGKVSVIRKERIQGVM